MPRSFAAIGLVLIAGCDTPARAADQQSLPPPISSEMSQSEQTCTAGKPLFEKGFITRTTADREGVNGFVLDYRHFACSGRHSLFCGTNGCEMEVFAADRTGAVQPVFDGIARSLKFAKVGGHSAIILDIHTQGCDKKDKPPCQETLLWDGAAFDPSP